MYGSRSRSCWRFFISTFDASIFVNFDSLRFVGIENVCSVKSLANKFKTINIKFTTSIELFWMNIWRELIFFYPWITYDCEWKCGMRETLACISFLRSKHWIIEEHATLTLSITNWDSLRRFSQFVFSSSRVLSLNQEISKEVFSSVTVVKRIRPVIKSLVDFSVWFLSDLATWRKAKQNFTCDKARCSNENNFTTCLSALPLSCAICTERYSKRHEENIKNVKGKKEVEVRNGFRFFFLVSLHHFCCVHCEAKHSA